MNRLLTFLYKKHWFPYVGSNANKSRYFRKILEHLFNPLYHLTEVKGMLSENGKIILSTPLAKPRVLWAKKHFHEMSIKSIKALFEASGFKIIRQEIFRVHPFIFYFSGVMPLLRLFYDKIQIYELSHF